MMSSDTPDLIFREAAPADYDVVFELFSQLQTMHHNAMPAFFKPPVKDRHFRTFFDEVMNEDRLHITLALVTGKPVGYVHYGVVNRLEDIYEKHNRYVYIQQLIVTLSERGHGYGSALIDYVKDFCCLRNVTDLGIDCWLFNEAARQCFVKAGFETHQCVMWLANADEHDSHAPTRPPS